MMGPTSSPRFPVPPPRVTRRPPVGNDARKAALLAIAWSIGSLIAPGCRREPPAPAAPTPLRVAAASDLQAAFPVLAARFRLDRGIAVEGTFGASGQLAQQVRQGAPFDLFLSANRRYVAGLADEGVVDRGSVRAYARGTLVLALNAAIPDGKGLDSLRSASVRRIAIATPELAPYGLAAKQAMERSGVWSAVEAKVVRAESVRQAVGFVASGDAEAGLVALSVADAGGVRVVAVDEALYDPIEQVLGVVSASARGADARAFAEFLAGPAGRGILAEFGLRPPLDSPAAGPRQSPATPATDAKEARP